jgi:hypothetical protein
VKLTNDTGFNAEIFRSSVGDRRIAASVVVRITFDVRGQTVTVAGDQPWRVSGEPVETEYGVMEADQFIRRGGVDLFVFGSAVAPQMRKTTRMEVAVDVGSFSRRAVVTGDRAWFRSAGNRLVPTAPIPFIAMPLSLERAFGGAVTWDGLELKHPDNPKGSGYYSSADEAVGKLLPNIEEPGMQVREWSDRPTTAGFTFCSQQSHIRLQNAIEMDAEGRLTAIKPLFFNSAFPKMIAPAVSPGDPVCLTGMAADGPQRFAIPPTPARVRLRFDDEVAEYPLKIEQVGFEVEKHRMFVGYRFGFRYDVVPGQLRACELIKA